MVEEKKEPKKEKKVKERKGKKERKNKKTSERWKKYKIQQDKIVKEGKFCPRCGPGVFLAKHKDRIFCGKCHYTEYVK
ncbi:MAG: 30S ribosomal protein S27ae [Candidatus Pacearchaeota archaeon]